MRHNSLLFVTVVPVIVTFAAVDITEIDGFVVIVVAFSIVVVAGEDVGPRCRRVLGGSFIKKTRQRRTCRSSFVTVTILVIAEDHVGLASSRTLAKAHNSVVLGSSLSSSSAVHDG